LVASSSTSFATNALAAPVDWDELAEIDRTDAYTIADAERLLNRTKSSKLKTWGVAAQSLPVSRR